jgi:hypothetical protein
MSATDSCSDGAPEWVLVSPTEWNAATGFATVEKGGAQLSRTLAINEAKERLTLKIREKLKQAFTKITGENSMTGNEKAIAAISGDLTLTQSKQRYIWQSPCNNLYVYIVIAPADAVFDIEQAAKRSGLPAGVSIGDLMEAVSKEFK